MTHQTALGRRLPWHHSCGLPLPLLGLPPSLLGLPPSLLGLPPSLLSLPPFSAHVGEATCSPMKVGRKEWAVTSLESGKGRLFLLA